MPIGWLSDHYDRRKILILICLIAAISAIGCFLVSGTTILFYIFFFLVGGSSLAIYGQCLAHTNDHISPQQYVAAGSSLILINGVGAAFGPLIVSTLMSVFGTNMYFPTLSIIFFILFLYGLYRSKVRAPIPVEEQSEAMVTVPRSAPIVMNITEEQSDKDK